ncbi:hypothetical protein WN51_10104 [Melipona quadrifasciata]|uniref:Uncharacterized protein n=1 Tax=Melipona quadrifasciata TaxID=166423 RepID=A0A0M9A974_9HYME|nr:hypothetical protein WN51_10104 [Melipona quadrifasciata]
MGLFCTHKWEVIGFDDTEELKKRRERGGGGGKKENRNNVTNNVTALNLPIFFTS